jgi:hypothetical protein
MLWKKGRWGSASGEPQPADADKSYLERYRGTEWDSGFEQARERGPDSISIFTGILTLGFIFIFLLVIWLLIGGLLPVS